MKKQTMNPYLPLYEYVPDGEPRIFGNRLYVYGSHDIVGSTQFCEGDYVVWSAPLSDLSDWKYEGVSYPYDRTEAAIGEAGNLAAPDCVQGTDGRYYLYYNRGARNSCEVAVSNTPQGPFTYYANVSFPDGNEPEIKMFDPGVLVDDDGRVYLYVGFCPTPDSPWITVAGRYSQGFELEADMHTIKTGPMEILPGCLAAKGTEYEGHGFYEASSPRKIGERYYMVYSSEQSHDLCWAVSDQPLADYHYGGILISNADIGFNGNATPKAPYGNTHGGLVALNGQWYVFYHRHTHGIECCRQGCAEPVILDENGAFHQAEMTCCGLNCGPLHGIGTYNATYACNLTHHTIGKERLTIRKSVRSEQPHFFELCAKNRDPKDALHYIANMQDGTVAGFKYFTLGQAKMISITLNASAPGVMDVFLDEVCTHRVAHITFSRCTTWQCFVAPFTAAKVVSPLFFRLNCPGKVNWEEFTLSE